MRRHWAKRISLAILAIGAHYAVAANLVTNSEFDTDLSGWVALDGNVEWSADDCCGNAASGSASMPLIDTDQAVLGSECVAVAPGAAYDLVLFAETQQIPPGFLGGHGAASVWWFRSGEPCGFGVVPPGQPSLDIPAADGWRSFGMTIAAPADAVAARVALSGQIAGLSVAVDLHFDHVLFGPTGTVPVGLQSFDVE